MAIVDSVIQLFKLVCLLGFGLVFLLGQGWLLVGPILHGSLTVRQNNTTLRQEIPLALLSGLIINYGTLLIVQILSVSLIVGCMLSVFGIGCFSLYVFKYHRTQILSPESINKWGFAFVVSLIFLSAILVEPLRDWDARSVWFFQGKIIYQTNSIAQVDSWLYLLREKFFSPPEYPKLLPALAAQITYIIGFWNEYIPKVSIFFLFVPSIIWLSSFFRGAFSSLVLLLLLPFSFGKYMWNGYLDGYMAIYFAIAMLLFGRYLKSSQPVDLVSGVGCMMLLLHLKSEGALAALVGVFSLGLVIYFLRKHGLLVKKLRLKYTLGVLVGLFPYILWSVYKRLWGISNYLEIGSEQSVLRIIDRLKDGSYKLILEYTYMKLEPSLLLFALLFFAYLAWNKPFPREIFPALFSAIIYCFSVIVIYLLTPADLLWHLNTSVGRVMFLVNASIFVSTYYLLTPFDESNKEIQ